MAIEGALLNVSISPHIKAPLATRHAMRLVGAALLLPLLAGILIFGARALLIAIVSVASCIAWESAWQLIRRRPNTIADSSAAVTGILLALSLPPGVPFWIPVVGGLIAIIIAKQFFGGIGQNIVNPALAGRVALVALWPALMTTSWIAPAGGTLSGIDSISAATPLGLLKNAAWYGDPDRLIMQLNAPSTIQKLLLGNTGGCLGETSALALLAAGIFLLVSGLTDFRIVAAFAASFALLTVAAPTRGSLLFHFFSGGLLLAMFFMATDWVTTPVTKSGRWIFGVGCGVLTAAIRQWSVYPEGASYAVLLMNILTPLIDKFTSTGLLKRVRHLAGRK